MRVLSVVLVCLLTGCAGLLQPPPEKLTLTKTDFADLPGWDRDTIYKAVPAFLRSCAALTKKPPGQSLGVAGKIQDWAAPCAELVQLPRKNNKAVHDFFEHEFQPYEASNKRDSEGLFTGYYEAQLRGAWHSTKRYWIPLYARPQDLGFGKDPPYDSREEIMGGSLKGRAHILLWVDDPVDAFFLAIQGSGRVRMRDGTIMRVGYDGANGQNYVAIGRVLADLHALERPVTMEKIRAWFKAHPDRAQAVMNLNPSYVFSKIMKTGPVGAEGVVLTPRRSLAIDPHFVPLGVPIWLDTKDGRDTVLQKLVMAQDKGGAIKGPVRGDFFWGAGAEAEAEAGAMQSPGHYYLLLPKTVDVHEGQ